MSYVRNMQLLFHFLIFLNLFYFFNLFIYLLFFYLPILYGICLTFDFHQSCIGQSQILDMHDIQIFHSDSSIILPILTVVLLTNKTRIYRDFLDLVVPGQSHRTVRVWPTRLVPGSICEDNKREPNRLCPCSYLLKFLFPAFSVAQFKNKQYFKPKPVFSTLCSCFPLLSTAFYQRSVPGYNWIYKKGYNMSVQTTNEFQRRLATRLLCK